ncbi:hypothetical protein DACRYDRAFT_112782 [Dacryopinax primogenitus]|uniref:Uncharacterized protein n=1 Tax=Dacryopinax primogenitus (strain DJM 731) TaxID=1858805 RepID=M5GBX7_DACPD|nr:uncharacterized protein DACRYDRAFT_112782 [Dacryopinax primogenitus]EJU05960.1 hypothetical protein DACRYDRAFT_112782 [Dacryopinax primogenitus]
MGGPPPSGLRAPSLPSLDPSACSDLPIISLSLPGGCRPPSAQPAHPVPSWPPRGFDMHLGHVWRLRVPRRPHIAPWPPCLCLVLWSVSDFSRGLSMTMLRMGQFMEDGLDKLIASKEMSCPTFVPHTRRKSNENPKNPLCASLEDCALYLLGTNLPPSTWTGGCSITAWTVCCALSDGTTLIRMHEAQEFRNARGQFWRRAYTALHQAQVHERVAVLLKVANADVVGWDGFHSMVTPALNEWSASQGKNFDVENPDGTRRDVVALLKLLENGERKLMYTDQELEDVLLKYEYMVRDGKGRCYGVFPLFETPSSSGSDAETTSSDEWALASSSSNGQSRTTFYRAPHEKTLYLVAHTLVGDSSSESSRNATWSLAYPTPSLRLRPLQLLSSTDSVSYAWGLPLEETGLRRVIRLSEPGRFRPRELKQLLTLKLGEVRYLSETDMSKPGASPVLAQDISSIFRLVQHLGGVTFLPGVVDLEQELAALDRAVAAELFAESEERLCGARRESAKPPSCQSLEVMFQFLCQ